MQDLSKRNAGVSADSPLDLFWSRAILEHFFPDQIDFLYRQDSSYEPSIICGDVLKKYFDFISTNKILKGETYFFDINKQENRGRFELQIADKLMRILAKQGYRKKTNFISPDTFELGPYSISFMTDQEYADGLILYIGEFTADCESLGKPGENYCLFDLLSDTSRTFLIRKNGKIVGQSLVFLNSSEDTLVFSSVACLANVNTQVIKTLVESYAQQLLVLNQRINQVTIGLGGRNFVSMNGTEFKRHGNKATAGFSALGKIRYAQDVSSCEEEIKLCEKIMGYPILRESNHIIQIKDAKKYKMEPENRKDCYRVACIISIENYNEKTQTINRDVAYIKETLFSKTKVNQDKQDNHSKKRLGNIYEFMKRVAALAGRKLNRPFSIEQISRRNKNNVSFAITPVSKQEHEALAGEIAQLSDYNVTRFRPNDRDRKANDLNTTQESLFICARLSFFSNGTKGAEKLWGKFCKNVESELSQETLPQEQEKKPQSLP